MKVITEQNVYLEVRDFDIKWDLITQITCKEQTVNGDT